MLPQTGLEKHQKITLEIGSSVVLSAAAFGVQFGHWSVWTVLVAVAAYFVWVIAYSEATVRVSR